MFLIRAINYSTVQKSDCPKALYKFLLRECEKLPASAKKHYQFTVRQSYKQHMNESDPQRIKEIVNRSYEDAVWVLKKYKKE